MSGFLKRFAVMALIAGALSWTALVRTDGFSPDLITLPLQGESAAAELSVMQALLQPYHYLGKGRQAFVFESLDGHTVIKFFNRKHIEIPWYTVLLPSTWKHRELQKRTLRQQCYAQGYLLAWKELREETGLLYVHQGVSQASLPLLTIVDKAGAVRNLDLNRIPFVLQKKGKRLYPTIEAMYREEGIGGVHRAIDAFVALIFSQIAKKIANEDQNVEDNIGFINEKPCNLDPGRLHYADNLWESARLQQELRRGTHRFREWLAESYPEAVCYLDKQIERRSL